MKFVIIEVERLKALGIDSREFRKSVDNSLAIVHEPFIRPVADTGKMQKYEHDSFDLNALLSSAEWINENYEYEEV